MPSPEEKTPRLLAGRLLDTDHRLPTISSLLGEEVDQVGPKSGDSPAAICLRQIDSLPLSSDQNFPQRSRYFRTASFSPFASRSRANDISGPNESICGEALYAVIELSNE